MKLSHTLLVSGVGLFAALHAYSQSASFDFETAGQFGSNFRGVSLLGGTAAQTSNDVANDFVVHDRQTATSSGVAYLYDTTPGDSSSGTNSVFSTTLNLTAGFDFYTATANSSLAIIFADSTNLSNNVMALLTISNTGTAVDQLRFFKDGTVNTSSLTAGTQVGSNLSQDVGIHTGTTFTSGNGYSATLSVSGTTPTIALTAGGLSTSQAFSAGDMNWTSTVVMLRLFDPASSASAGIGIDNFYITQIPEPSNMAMVSALFVGMSVIARRRRQ
ncbi:MAG: hypothetical protein K0R17_1452 [Rariglobus sp.]|jgi:hypothetical protein|nr:hypothetical protein [Rariglobus sp.]